VSRAASQESFMANIIKLGLNKEHQFVYSLEEVRAMQAKDMPDLDLVNLRTGARAATSDILPEEGGDKVEFKYSKTSQYYVPREMYADMQKQFQRSTESNLSSDKLAIEKTLQFLKFGVGASLASKTLFSVGFYIRNMLGNVAFFAPLVGLSPLKVIAAHKRIPQMFMGNMKGLDAYTANLVRLNLVHGDLTAHTITELLKGNTSLKNLEAEAEALTSKIDKLLKAGKDVSDKTVVPVMKVLVATSQAIDSVYKIAYFDSELETLKKARDSDRSRGVPEGKKYNLSDDALEVKAAHTVRATSQSYVDAFEVVKYATGKFSFLLPPFVRFRTDIIRILLSIPVVIKSEITSGNDVMRSRGFKRLRGFTFTVGGMGMLLPYLSQTILAGLSDEEDEMLRESLPDWQKNASLFFTGKNTFYDLTYVNPVSGITNIATQGMGEVFSGHPVKGLFKALGMMRQEYGGGQIVTNALLDVTANRDARTGDQIHGGMDGGFESFMDMTSYVFKESYAPRGATALYKAGKAAFGDEPLDDRKSVTGILAREFYPARSNTIDWTRVFQKGISSSKADRLRARNKIKKIMTQGSLMDGEIKGAAREYVDGQQIAAAKLYRYMRAAEKAGVSRRQITSSLKYSKVSMAYADLTRRGVYKRDAIPETLVGDIRASGNATLIERLNKAHKYINEEYTRYIPLD